MNEKLQSLVCFFIENGLVENYDIEYNEYEFGETIIQMEIKTKDNKIIKIVYDNDNVHSVEYNGKVINMGLIWDD